MAKIPATQLRRTSGTPVSGRRGVTSCQPFPETDLSKISWDWTPQRPPAAAPCRSPSGVNLPMTASAMRALVADWSDGPPANWENHSLPGHLEGAVGDAFDRGLLWRGRAGAARPHLGGPRCDRFPPELHGVPAPPWSA
jgi:hypothetical protein